MAFVFLLLYVLMLFVRPQEWIWAVYGVHLQDYLAIAAGVTVLGSVGSRRLGMKSAPQSLLIVGLFLAVALSHVRHFYLDMLVETVPEFGKAVLLFLFIVLLVNTPKRLKIFLLVLVIGCLFLSAQGIMQYQRGFGFGGPGRDVPIMQQDIVRVRAFGVFNDPNDLALMLVTAIPILGIIAFGKRVPIWLRSLGLAALAPMVYTVCLTNSRGGWLALGVMGVVFVWMNFSRKIGILLCVALIITMAVAHPARAESIGQRGAGHSRLILWGNGNQMLKQYPLFGVGKGRFTDYSESSQVAHNSFVQCYAELGLFGYFFWFGLVMGAFWDMWALRRHATDEPGQFFLKQTGAALLAGMYGYFAAAMFLSRTYVQPLYVVLALSTALRMTYENEYGEIPNAFSRDHLKRVGFCALASIPAIYIMIRILA